MGSSGLRGGLFTNIFCGSLMVMLSEQQLQEKVLQYEAFISDVLQRDLKKVLEQRDEIYEKIAQYLQLKNVIERLQETGSQELKTQVDLGCHFYVNAEVFEGFQLIKNIWWRINKLRARLIFSGLASCFSQSLTMKSIKRTETL
ncbi:protein UXT isoform X3 [Ahaetulla prasina]|uniref:protein UXT isoform X3 n=1 Tax=Ahaetulla prasina TaxID=499056 RepID=UPI002648843A|nr:protein UXT isoform X3 [Ahaetulla prasina]